MRDLKKYFPVFEWGRSYSRNNFSNDFIAAVIVTIMLIPQSLAYALLAGLPPEIGLYASTLPLLAYAIFGTSRTLAVGPVAVISLMTAAAIGQLGLTNTADVVAAAITLAMLSGLILLAMGVFRLGFLANVLSHPVIAGFIAASGLIIAGSQIKHILGIPVAGNNLIEQISSIYAHIADTNMPTVVIGIFAILLLVWIRNYLKPVLVKLGLKSRTAELMVKCGPVVAVAITALTSWAFNLQSHGVAVVGFVPSGLPTISAPSFDPELVRNLILSAVLISVVGFVESVSVAQTLAAKRRQRIDLNQELIGLGASNVASSVTGGYPVTGGFARSVVNFDAGAETPAAGAYTAVGIALSTITLTPLLFYLPKATLAATILVAIFSLINFSILKHTWHYSKTDFLSVCATILVTLGHSVEMGILSGVVASIALYVLKTSKPHIAEVGLVPGTEHFRNIARNSVITCANVVTIRVDESLYFANARFLEDYIYNRISEDADIRHFVLMCSAVNEIDSSALESLRSINRQLAQAGVTFHLSEVKGPVMDRLKRGDLLEELTGDVFLSQYQAACKLDPDLLQNNNRSAPNHAEKPDEQSSHIVSSGSR